MKFSVIIPAYNEQRSIGASVRALQQQNIARNEFEIIVVDNNSKDDTSQQARAAGADKVIVETVPGTNFARQRGFVESSGEIVAFLDADSEPATNWLQKIEQDLKLPGVAAVSGPFDYGFLGTKKRLDWFYTRYLLPKLPAILRFLFHRKAGVLIGGNFAVWRKSLEAIGGLPPLAFWGDDAATAMLISRKVGTVMFDSNLAVKSSPRRFEKKGFFQLALRYEWAYIKVYFSSKFV